ncbi:hypothetical protein AB0395_33400 [Streptosporangium sp. NPDC051023]|uniref:hypothetical protein n=1 Tax=Streptosporangium sp. NPDC051023 TaxID=3155410 RepID=UPI003450A2B5
MIGDIEVRHGFTLADLEQMTRAALVADRSMAADISDRRDAAWSAIAEHLCAAETPPTRAELIRVGWQAIYREIRDGYRHYGYADRRWDAGVASGPRFVAYWYSPVQPSHEERIVERLAVGQVLARLTPTYRDAVAALATADDYVKAAELLGIGYKALVARVGTARKTVLRLWHEGETPRRVRRTDRRVGVHGVELATHCPHGHEWTPENTQVRYRILRGKRHRSRVCRACQHERSVRRAAAAREAKASTT